jgi:hypothetical protein
MTTTTIEPNLTIVLSSDDEDFSEVEEYLQDELNRWETDGRLTVSYTGKDWDRKEGEATVHANEFIRSLYVNGDFTITFEFYLDTIVATRSSHDERAAVFTVKNFETFTWEQMISEAASIANTPLMLMNDYAESGDSYVANEWQSSDYTLQDAAEELAADYVYSNGMEEDD